MYLEHLNLLACPECRAGLAVSEAREGHRGRVSEGALACEGCSRTFQITHGVPRFVQSENYADNFGFQWNLFATTQHDSANGLGFSHERFFHTTQWPESMAGEVLLEAGSGAGRFTEIACDTGAMVVSFDLSSAVDANYRQNGHRPNVLIVQGDIRRPPVPEASFDRVFCMGVLQHTPSPRKSFLSLAPHLRPGGSVAVDVYTVESWTRWFTSYRRYHWFTRHMSTALLYRSSKAYVEVVYPIVRQMWKLSGNKGRNWAKYLFLMKNYFRRHGIDVTPEFEKEWTVMQLVDQLGAYYDKPQTVEKVREWFEEADLVDWEVVRGGNGIIGRGKRSACELAAV